jgi:hypothetical protein
MMKILLPACCAMLVLIAATTAQGEPLVAWVESTPQSQLWINAGFYSWHFQRDKGLNDRNPGFGAEYRFSSVAAVTAGRFYNSERKYSNYAGLYYQPVSLGPLRLGLVAGGFDGYPKMRHGGWFLAAIPTASLEMGRVGVNLAFVPSWGDRLHGALSLQFKLKLFD